jgi:hypothetical protein
MAFIAVLLALFAPLVVAFNRIPVNGMKSTALAAKSKSVPFLEAPKNLNGLVGSKEFDPLGFSDVIDVRFLQEAEIKHCRLAMLGKFLSNGNSLHSFLHTFIQL